MTSVFANVVADVSKEFVVKFPEQFDFLGMLQRVCEDAGVNITISHTHDYKLHGLWAPMERAHGLLASTLAVYGATGTFREDSHDPEKWDNPTSQPRPSHGRGPLISGRPSRGQSNSIPVRKETIDIRKEQSIQVKQEIADNGDELFNRQPLRDGLRERRFEGSYIINDDEEEDDDAIDDDGTGGGADDDIDDDDDDVESEEDDDDEDFDYSNETKGSQLKIVYESFPCGNPGDKTEVKTEVDSDKQQSVSELQEKGSEPNVNNVSNTENVEDPAVKTESVLEAETHVSPKRKRGRPRKQTETKTTSGMHTTVKSVRVIQHPRRKYHKHFTSAKYRTRAKTAWTSSMLTASQQILKRKRGRPRKNPDEMPADFPCNECDFKAKSRNQLGDHKHRVHLAKPTKCDICEKVFPNVRYMKRHRTSHVSPQHCCDVCGKMYKILKALRDHRKTHEVGYTRPEFPCDMCTKSFCTRYILECHVKSEHLGLKKSFLCSTCGKSFTTKHTLIQHANVHQGVKPYTCEICGKSFSYESALRDHKYIHLGVKKFHCTFCKKSFRQRSALKMHEKIHAEVKDFSCKECGRGFTQKQALQRHERAHKGDKPFSCKLCARTFGDASIIRRHMILVHKLHKDPKTWREDIVARNFTMPMYVENADGSQAPAPLRFTKSMERNLDQTSLSKLSRRAEPEFDKASNSSSTSFSLVSGVQPISSPLSSAESSSSSMSAPPPMTPPPLSQPPPPPPIATPPLQPHHTHTVHTHSHSQSNHLPQEEMHLPDTSHQYVSSVPPPTTPIAHSTPVPHAHQVHPSHQHSQIDYSQFPPGAITDSSRYVVSDTGRYTPHTGYSQPGPSSVGDPRYQMASVLPQDAGMARPDDLSGKRIHEMEPPDNLSISSLYAYYTNLASQYLNMYPNYMPPADGGMGHGANPPPDN